MIKRVIVLVVLFISGCASKPFQPPSYEYEDWTSVDKLDTKKAILECGNVTPFNSPNMTNNEYTLFFRCMIKSGFQPKKYHLETYDNMCNDPKGAFCGTDMHGVMHCQPRPQACDLPWDKIPDRNITKRFESDYCKHKIYRTYPVCQP